MARGRILRPKWRRVKDTSVLVDFGYMLFTLVYLPICDPRGGFVTTEKPSRILQPYNPMKVF